MLQELHIKNIALINEVAISLGTGLNVLSGETGAGKSIVVDSVNLILGARADKDLIQSGEQRAFVEAQLELPDAAEDLAEEYGDSTLIISRELRRDGKNVCRINGRLVPLMTLRDVTGRFVTIHGQNQHQEIFDEKNHINILDDYLGKAAAEKKAEVQAVWEAYGKCRRNLETMEMDAAEKARKTDMLRYEIAEIEKAELSVGEDEERERQKKLLENAEELAGQLDRAKHAVQNGGMDSLRTAMKALEAVAAFDEKYAAASEEMNDLYYRAEELSYEVAALAEGVVFDPAKLEENEGRLAEIWGLKRKYGATIEEILAFAEQAREELDALERLDERNDELQRELIRLEQELAERCGELSNLRKKGAQELEKEIVSQLSDLGMEDALFSAGFTKKGFSANGTDDVEFYISLNKGEPQKPLSKVVSGGEASRIMLALKNIEAIKGSADTVIFDEIDAGISGRMALVVARKMAAISKDRQVICVTHLPQIAAMGDSNYYISKAVTGERTVTSVERIDGMKKAEEVARLSGGISTKTSIKHAEELIESAENWKKTGQ